MSSVTDLRVAYYSLNIVGGLAISLTFIIISFIFIIRRRRRNDGPFPYLTSIALCLSRIISTLISCFLLFFGAMTGTAPPRTVCIAQSGLQASQASLLAYPILSYALNVLLLTPPPSLLMGTVVGTATLSCLLLLPFLTFAAVAIVSALIASQNPRDVSIHSFYCFLNRQDIRICSAVLAGVGLLAAIAVIAQILYTITVRKDPSGPSSSEVEVEGEGEEGASGSRRWVRDIVLQLICLGLYAALRLGFLVANSIQPTVVADMVDAADSIVIFIIVTTQPWLFKPCLPGVNASTHRTGASTIHSTGAATTRSTGAAHSIRGGGGGGGAAEHHHRHGAFLQRVAEYPSVIDIRRSESRQGNVNVNVTGNGNGNGNGGRQTPKLRALSAALGLAAVAGDPYPAHPTHYPAHQYQHHLAHQHHQTQGSRYLEKYTTGGTGIQPEPNLNLNLRHHHNHHPYAHAHAHALDPPHQNIISGTSGITGSRPSLKSLEYGVALGHPSRDVSASRSGRSGRAETITPNNEGRPASLLVLSTPPSDASSHAVHLPLPLDDDSNLKQRAAPSPLTTANLGRQRWYARRASDSSIPHAHTPPHTRTHTPPYTHTHTHTPPRPSLSPPRISFEGGRSTRRGQGQDSPLRASFMGVSVSMESVSVVSSGVSPRASPRASRNVRTSSLDPPPSLTNRWYHGHGHGHGAYNENSNGEGSMYLSASAESSPHLFMDDITSSMQSWPDNVSHSHSRSTLQLSPAQDRTGENDNAAARAGTGTGFSRSSIGSEFRWVPHSHFSVSDLVDEPQPPHPAFLRESDTPSPLSLNEEGSFGGAGGAGGADTFGGPSPVERRLHPYTRGPSPLRPPGLGSSSPLYRWTEEIEETMAREGSKES